MIAGKNSFYVKIGILALVVVAYVIWDSRSQVMAKKKDPPPPPPPKRRDPIVLSGENFDNSGIGNNTGGGAGNTTPGGATGNSGGVTGGGVTGGGVTGGGGTTTGGGVISGGSYGNDVVYGNVHKSTGESLVDSIKNGFWSLVGSPRF